MVTGFGFMQSRRGLLQDLLVALQQAAQVAVGDRRRPATPSSSTTAVMPKPFFDIS